MSDDEQSRLVLAAGKFGAGDGDRTRDVQLGNFLRKMMFYVFLTIRDEADEGKLPMRAWGQFSVSLITAYL